MKEAVEKFDKYLEVLNSVGDGLEYSINVKKNNTGKVIIQFQAKLGTECVDVATMHPLLSLFSEQISLEHFLNSDYAGK